MDWTEETIARLKELWEQGLSTAEIGRQIGITKNAVVGKAHRLGLPARPSPIRRPGGKSASAKAADVEKSSAPAERTVAAAEVVAEPSVSVVTTAPAPAAVSVENALAPPIAAEPIQEASPAAEVAEAVLVVETTQVSIAAETVMEAPRSAAAAPVKAAEARPAASSPATANAVSREQVATPSPVPVKAAAPRAAFRNVVNPPAESRRRGPSCCWPLGDPGTPGFRFCGAAPLAGKPYCAEHASLAYVKLRDRRDNVA
ncbi:GcrA cell cycle regulator [Acetobacter sacchari]|uniref:GcrA cell cycle regulator n=1 Tax=Acetobacter sacchari TaxID=2661687 RepID=A0ABS3LT49_9PROT|nr:GcrA family cell cycle regulator [Acetobacter sacchari]MBO1359078.1 GcrA cell cycle regulator [Acetobacter sacchari]